VDLTDLAPVPHDGSHLTTLQQFKTNLERMVDSLSYVVAPLLPEWTDPADGA
jgi:hypothetical protein